MRHSEDTFGPSCDRRDPIPPEQQESAAVNHDSLMNIAAHDVGGHVRVLRQSTRDTGTCPSQSFGRGHAYKLVPTPKYSNGDFEFLRAAPKRTEHMYRREPGIFLSRNKITTHNVFEVRESRSTGTRGFHVKNGNDKTGTF